MLNWYVCLVAEIRTPPSGGGGTRLSLVSDSNAWACQDKRKIPPEGIMWEKRATGSKMEKQEVVGPIGKKNDS